MDNNNDSKNEIPESRHIGEFAKEIMGDLKNKIEHPPVVIKDGEIGFPEHAPDYWLDLDKIKTEIDLVRWINHLLGKNWITKDLLGIFIQTVCHYRNWLLY